MDQFQMIYKSNALVEAAYRLSVQEQRIILACIAQVRRDEPVTDEIMYSVTAEAIASMAGVPIESSYTQLKEAALRLKRREVRLTHEPNGNGKKRRTIITGWVQTIVYCDGEGRVELRFSKDMLPYLTELTRQFTKYALADVVKMSSPHAIRLYELLVQWDLEGKREIEIDQLRTWLQLEARYPLMADFRRWVIEPSIEQINQHSPLQVSWSQRKTGRKISHLLFEFFPKQSIKKSKRIKVKPITETELSQLALPGETKDQALQRLGRAH